MQITPTTNHRLTVNLKLLFSVSAIILLIVGLQSWYHLNNASQQNQIEAKQKLLNLFQDYDLEIKVLGRASAALSTSFADRPDVQELFLARDREGLLTLLTPVFNTLKEEDKLVHLYLHEPNGLVFVRVHDPKKFGDDVTYRRTVATAIETQKTVPGIEIGPNRLGIRSVSPLLHQGEMIGLVEVGLDFDEAFIDNLKAENGADYKMWVTNSAAASAGLKPKDSAPESPMPETFYYAGTDPTSLPIPAAVYQRVLAGGAAETWFGSADGEARAVLVAPLKGYGERVIGVLEISQTQTQTLQRSQSAILGIAAGLAILALALMWFASNQFVLRPLKYLTDVARRQITGNLAARVELIPNDEFGQLGYTLNTLTEELETTLKNQQSIIAEQTRKLETVVEISNHLTGILELGDLLRQVVNITKESFNYYHTHIYLLDEQKETLYVAEGYGQAGADMKGKGHHILLDAPRSLVARAAREGRIITVENVRIDPTWLPNPLLPETHSEMAVPVLLGDEIVGVLDVQSEQVGGLTAQDEAALQALANQLAIALRNARLFVQSQTALKETQAALKEIERLNRRLTREAWQESTQELTTPGYRYVSGRSSPISSASEGWLAPMKLAASQKQLVKQVYPGNGGAARAEIALPLMLRGEVIGVLGVKREETPDWAEEEVAAIEAVANQVALALENARLSKEQEKTIGQLKDIDRLKSEFLTSMSHELRTPLNSIIGFADVLLQGIDGELNDMALNDIQLIHNSSKHLLALINDILDLAKIESGKMELVREAVDVKEITGAVLATSSSLIKDKPVQITIDVPEILPPVYADKLRLNQILLNLVSNAAKFTHNGTITIKAALPDHKPDMMTISIIDTGIGIPTNKLNTIFERFLQADAGTTRKYGGTGLGLAICRQLIELHGGSLNVRSREGVGSEFYFDVPLASIIIV